MVVIRTAYCGVPVLYIFEVNEKVQKSILIFVGSMPLSGVSFLGDRLL